MSQSECPIRPNALIEAFAEQRGYTHSVYRGSLWTQGGGAWIEVELEHLPGRIFKITVEEIT